MEKYFLTYQPQSVANILETDDYVAKNSNYSGIKNEFGYNPIFFIPIETKLELFIKNIFTTPSKPDVMIIVKLHKYDCIDAAKWYDLKDTNKYSPLRVSEKENCEKEYISDKIYRNSVEKIYSVKDILQTFPKPELLNKNSSVEKNITRSIMQLRFFWDILDDYFQDRDKIDMIKFLNSLECYKAMSKYFIKFLTRRLSPTFSQTENMQYFRKIITTAYNNYYKL